MTTTLGLYVFDGVEVLDFAGPFEVFTTASRVHARQHPSASPLLRVCTIARSRSQVTARAGLVVNADATIAEHPPLDVLIVPGGVVTAELDRRDVIAWVASQASHVQIVASVCTGAFLLGRAGLLDNFRATTHWEDLVDLRSMFPRVDVVDGVRWVDQGRVVTSAGISAGVDMCLHLVERLFGRSLALATARQLDFDWVENT